MKKVISIALVLLLAFTFACNKKTAKSDFGIDPLAIEVPAELKDNPEIVKFIKTSEKSINEFANTIEKIYMENPNLINKNADEMSMGEKIKMMKIAGQMAMSFGEFAVNYSELNVQLDQLEQGLTEEQTIALATVADAFEKRMQLLEERLEKLNVN